MQVLLFCQNESLQPLNVPATKLKDLKRKLKLLLRPLLAAGRDSPVIHVQGHLDAQLVQKRLDRLQQSRHHRHRRSIPVGHHLELVEPGLAHLIRNCEAEVFPVLRSQPDVEELVLHVK